MNPAELKLAPAKRPHGTRARYASGCRCLPCRAANSRYQSERLRARRSGDWNGVVCSDRARRHIETLRGRGIGYKQIAAAADLPTSIVWGIKTGARPPDAGLAAAATVAFPSTGGIADAMTTRQRENCIVPLCDRPACSRGLCSACRQLSKKMINAGETTEEELIALKLLLPLRDPRSGMRSYRTAVAEARRKHEVLKPR